MWPRPNIESTKTVLRLPDRIGEPVDWSDAPLKKKWLFKEDMEGRVVLTVTVTPLRGREAPDELEDVLDLAGRSAARETPLTWRTLRDLIDLGGAAARYLLTGPQKPIAEGDVLIRERVSRTLRVPLVAPVDLYRRRTERPEREGPRTDLETGEVEGTGSPDPVSVEAGESNGYIDVNMSVWRE